jgi:hypothetical protein
VLGLAAGTRFSVDHPRGFGLANSLTGIGFNGFGDGKLGRLAFRHGKDEYGIKCVGAEVAVGAAVQNNTSGRRC